MDKNDALKEEIEKLKNAHSKATESAELSSKDMPNNITLSEEHSMVTMNHSGLFCPNFQATVESDEDIGECFGDHLRAVCGRSLFFVFWPDKRHSREQTLIQPSASTIQSALECGQTKAKLVRVPFERN